MTDTIEGKVSKTILQQPEDIYVGDEVYRVSPPSVATIILASEAVSQLPAVELNTENIASECLYIAKDCRILGDVIATLILGAKRITETRVVTRRRLWGLITRRETVTVDNRAALSRKLLEDVEPRGLHELMVKLLQSMQLGDFFGLTASLIEINLLRRTREAVTTASGQ